MITRRPTVDYAILIGDLSCTTYRAYLDAISTLLFSYCLCIASGVAGVFCARGQNRKSAPPYCAFIPRGHFPPDSLPMNSLT